MKHLIIATMAAAALFTVAAPAQAGSTFTSVTISTGGPAYHHVNYRPAYHQGHGKHWKHQANWRNDRWDRRSNFRPVAYHGGQYANGQRFYNHRHVRDCRH